jgi:hypothetical protein
VRATNSKYARIATTPTQGFRNSAWLKRIVLERLPHEQTLNKDDNKYTPFPLAARDDQTYHITLG